MLDTPVDYAIEDARKLPTSAGIYAIINVTNGHRYVGQAVNIRTRVLTHVRDLDAGKERTNTDMLLQKAWSQFGRANFVIRVLDVVPNNRGRIRYEVRPDNLALAEHYYINEKGEYNKDRRIVHSRFRRLIDQKAWRLPIDDAAIAHSASLPPRAYLVAKRVTWNPSVIVLAFGSQDAKERARVLSAAILALGGNLSTRRLSAEGVTRAIVDGATDLREE